jgi:hypothetical protein
MKQAAYIVTWAAIAAVFGLGIYAMGKKISIQGIGVLFVIVIPYLAGMWLLSRLQVRSSVRVIAWTLILLSLTGIYLISDAVFIHPTAQSSMIFMVLPVFIFPVVMLAGVIAFVLQRKTVK